MFQKHTKRKTVSWTGEILNDLGGKKVVTRSDGFSLDRDLNGARGIFIKTVVEKFSTTFGRYPLRADLST